VLIFCIDALKRILSFAAGEVSRRVKRFGGEGALGASDVIQVENSIFTSLAHDSTNLYDYISYVVRWPGRYKTIVVQLSHSLYSRSTFRCLNHERSSNLGILFIQEADTKRLKPGLHGYILMRHLQTVESYVWTLNPLPRSPISCPSLLSPHVCLFTEMPVLEMMVFEWI
jgi:hypothetical protein